MIPARILITGSRDWPCRDLAERVLDSLMRIHGDNLIVVHGDCPTGVDRAFREACENRKVTHEPHPADWAKHGKSAGPRRNQQMVDAGATKCLAFSQEIGRSRGTKDCAQRAAEAVIPTWLITSEDGAFVPWQG